MAGRVRDGTTETAGRGVRGGVGGRWGWSDGGGNSIRGERGKERA